MCSRDGLFVFIMCGGVCYKNCCFFDLLGVCGGVFGVVVWFGSFEWCLGFWFFVGVGLFFCGCTGLYGFLRGFWGFLGMVGGLYVFGASVRLLMLYCFCVGLCLVFLFGCGV